jgi:hypothetical protein
MPTDAIQVFTRKTERVPGPAEEPSLNDNKHDLKKRAIHELKEFLAMLLYLWVSSPCWSFMRASYSRRSTKIIKLTALQFLTP